MLFAKPSEQALALVCGWHAVYVVRREPFKRQHSSFNTQPP